MGVMMNRNDMEHYYEGATESLTMDTLVKENTIEYYKNECNKKDRQINELMKNLENAINLLESIIGTNHD